MIQSGYTIYQMEANDLCAPTAVIRNNLCIGTRATAPRGADEKISSEPKTDCACYNDSRI